MATGENVVHQALKLAPPLFPSVYREAHHSRLVLMILANFFFSDLIDKSQ